MHSREMNREDSKPAAGEGSTAGAIGRAMVLIMVLGLLDKVLALAKEVLMAARFGVRPEMDAFNIAYAFPGIVNLLINGACVAAFVPLYAIWRGKTKADEIRDNTLSVFYSAALFFIGLASLCCLGAPYILSVLGYGFVPDTMAMAVGMERWLVWLILVEGLGVVCCALLQSWKRFGRLTLAQALINVTIIAFLAAGRDLGIMALVYGLLAGTVLKVTAMLASLAGSGLRPQAPFRFRPQALLRFAHLALPLLGNALITKSNILVDQSMSTSLPAGGVAVLRYAYRVNDLPVQIIVFALSQAIFPYISEQASRGDTAGLRAVFRQSMVFLCLVCLPITCYEIVFAEDIVTVLLRRGGFDAEAARMTALTLRCYGLGLFFLAYTFINGVFYCALQQGVVMLRLGGLTLLLNFGFNWLFLKLLGGPHAIALSTTLTMAIISTIFLHLLLRKLGREAVQGLAPSFLSVAGASGVAVAVCVPLRAIAVRSGLPPWVTLGALTIVFATVTLLLILAFKTGDVSLVIDQCLPWHRRARKRP
jgi:putative peptidoglycan lipid II flippase